MIVFGKAGGMFYHQNFSLFRFFLFIIIFAKYSPVREDSGVSITGQISLYSGEVRNNWLNVIKTAPEYDVQLQSLPMWER